MNDNLGPCGEKCGSLLDKSDLRRLMAASDNRLTHDEDSLKALGGIFYTMAGERWCDTSRYSWKLTGPDLWTRDGLAAGGASGNEYHQGKRPGKCPGDAGSNPARPLIQ